MMRGRPLKREIRDNISAILSYVKYAYGYEIYKLYREIFGPISLRNLYYNLKKGLVTGEFMIVDIKVVNGNFTWGGESQHIYYSLGPYSSTLNIVNEKILEKLNALKPFEGLDINWEEQINNHIDILEKEASDFNSKKERMKYEDKFKTKELLKNRCNKLKEWIKLKIDDKDKIRIYNARINRIMDIVIKQDNEE